MPWFLPSMIEDLARKPILVRIGLLLGLVVVLAVVSMASSELVARATAGLAAAVNQSGSLRMQSYRIGMALADRTLAPVERAERVARLAGELESRLASPRLADAIPHSADHEVRAAYLRIWSSWRDRMRPPLLVHLRELRSGAQGAVGIPYLAEVDGFVAEIEALVGLLEQVAEDRIRMLQQIQWLALILTLLAVAVTLVLVARRVIVPLGELLTCADRARRGDFSGRTRFTGDDELGRLGSAMNLMGRDLSGLYRDLEERVAEKTQDLARESRRLALHEERGILARELHDSLAQSLSYLKIQAARLSVALDRGEGDRARTVLGELRQGIGSAYRQLRELLATFRLKMDDRGLQSALECTLEEYRRRGLAAIELDNRLPAGLLTPNEEIHVLQIVREALSNVARHAQAGHAWILLAPREDAVEVEIVDDGRGLRRNGDRAGHYGLSIMRERAFSLGGSLTIESPPAGGTRVRLAFRYRAAGDTQGDMDGGIGEAADAA